MNTHNTFPLAPSFLSEARLCYQHQPSPSQLPEAMRARQEMEKNPDLMRAEEAYEKFLKFKHPELLEQPDRTYFLAMVTSEMLLPAWEQRDRDALWYSGQRIDYGSYSRQNILAADPFDLVHRENVEEEVDRLEAEKQTTDQRMQLAERALTEAVKNRQSAEDVKMLRESAAAAQRAFTETEEALAKAQERLKVLEEERKAAAAAQEKWVKDGVVENAMMEKTAEQYLAWRARLDAILEEKGIRIPQKQSQDTHWAKDDLLREEYYRLLVLVSQGNAEEVAKASEEGLEGLRTLLTNEVRKLERADKVYAEFLPEEMGSTETLNKYGIVIGPSVHDAYWAMRSGTASRPEEAPPVAAGSPTLRPGESAAAWLDDPMLAWEFLKDPSTGFVSNPQNRMFLDALQFWNDPAGRGNRPTNPEFSEEATRDVLQLIVLSVLGHERMRGNSARQRSEIKLRENIGEKIEDQARGVWEYIKEYRDHPLGSVLAAGAAIVALRAIYRFLFKNEHNNFVKWAVRGGLIGLALGLYQKHASGKAWWEGAWSKVEQWRGKERVLKPEEQTLPRYWSLECNLTDPQKRDCLLLLEEQKSKDVLDWYGRMDQEILKGQVRNNASLPQGLQLPFRLDSTTKERVFGQKTNTEIALLFYTTLQEFFKNRGEAVKKDGGPLADRERPTDPATLGYHYIYEKYITRRLVESYAGSALYERNTPKIEIGPTIVKTKEPGGTERTSIWTGGVVTNERKWRSEHYQTVEQERDFANEPLWHIFTLEADAGILRKMGREAATPATVLEQLANMTKRLGGDVMEFGDKAWNVTWDGTKWTARIIAEKTGDAWEAVKSGGNALMEYVGNGGWRMPDGTIVKGPIMKLPETLQNVIDWASEKWEVVWDFTRNSYVGRVIGDATGLFPDYLAREWEYVWDAAKNGWVNLKGKLTPGPNPPSNPNPPTNNPPVLPNNPNNPTNVPPSNAANPNSPTNNPPAASNNPANSANISPGNPSNPNSTTNNSLLSPTNPNGSTNVQPSNPANPNSPISPPLTVSTNPNPPTNISPIAPSNPNGATNLPLGSPTNPNAPIVNPLAFPSNANGPTNSPSVVPANPNSPAHSSSVVPVNPNTPTNTPPTPSANPNQSTNSPANQPPQPNNPSNMPSTSPSNTNAPTNIPPSSPVNPTKQTNLPLGQTLNP